MEFTKATKKRARLRMALIGPPGSGKTYTALTVGTNLVPDGKVALIDTERGSASKYADRFDFQVLELDSFSPKTYVEAIKLADKHGFDVLIIDSLSHAWVGNEGALAQVDNIARRSKSGSSFNAWRDVTPQHNTMVDTILRSGAHVITTMRTKTEYVLEKNDRTGKTAPKKVGLAPVQRDGLEYEFDVVGDIDNCNLTVTKTRCSELTDAFIEKPGVQLAETLRTWLTDGVDAPEPMRMEAPPSEEDKIEAALEERMAKPEIKEVFDKLDATEAKRLATLRKYPDDEKLLSILNKKLLEKESEQP